jgi:hypothetical protein
MCRNLGHQTVRQSKLDAHVLRKVNTYVDYAYYNLDKWGLRHSLSPFSTTQVLAIVYHLDIL